MTILVIVLLLISFMIPAIQSLKKKSNEIKCKSNLKQIGSLVALYEIDNDGRIPGVWGNSFFFPKFHGLTEGWQGKLAMYLMGPDFVKEHPSIKDSEYGPAYMDSGQGYDALKVLICPSAADRYDPGFIGDSNYPHRRRYYIQSHSQDKLSLSGVPTSYSGVDGFFNRSFSQNVKKYGYPNLENVSARIDSNLTNVKFATNSIRRSDIKRSESKILLVEAVPDMAKYQSKLRDSLGHVFPLNSGRHAMTKDLGELRDYNLSFFHDDIEEWWISDPMHYGYVTDSTRDSLPKRFNEVYPYEAYKATLFWSIYQHYSIVTLKNPNLSLEAGSPSVYFPNFKVKYWGADNTGVTFTNPDNYYYEEEYQYMVGEMNVLKADLHVDKVSDNYLANFRYEYSSKK